MDENYIKDVKIIANALIEDAVLYMDGDYDTGYYCQYCDNGYQKDKKNYIHNLNCPVLIAKDLLTE